MTSNEGVKININSELYNKIVERIFKNKSNSCMIDLPDDDGTTRKYKVCMDEDKEIYIMRDGLKSSISAYTEEQMEGVIINNQIAYMKDELDADRRKAWGKLLEEETMKGLKHWVNMQNAVRRNAKTLLGLSIPHYKASKRPRVKQQMDLLIAIIKFDIENVKTKFDIYKKMYTDEIMEAETSSQDNKFRIYCPDTDEIQVNEEAYLTYCEKAKKDFEQMTKLVEQAHLDPLGPPPDIWDSIM